MRAVDSSSPHPGLILIAIVATVATIGVASPPTVAQTVEYEDRTAVVEVQVPVNVTDRNGNPVRGLTAAAFQIQDDGRKQAITYFDVIDLDEIEAAPGYEELVRQSIPGAVRRRFLFLFDYSFSRPTSLSRARRAAQEFVSTALHPTDLAAVAAFTVESGPELVLTFTPDRAALVRAIDLLGLPQNVRAQSQDPLRFIVADPSGAQAALASVEADSSVFGSDSVRGKDKLSNWDVVGRKMQEMEQGYARNKIAAWTSAMSLTARLLASVPGRKHVVYFSEGFDGRLLFGRQTAIRDADGRSDTEYALEGDIYMVDNDDRFGSTQLQNAATQMMADFHRADSVLQVVDISGLTTEIGGAGTTGRGAGREALDWVAEGTGGTLFEDANDFGVHLNEVLARSTVTYLLSFQPSHIDFDGANHRIKVKADLPRGTKLAYRAGYVAPREFGDLHPIERGLLAGDLIASGVPRNEIGLSVLAAAFHGGDRKAYVPVILEADGASILAGHEGEQVPIELYVYVTDKRGEMKDFFTYLVTLDVAKSGEPFTSGGLKYYGHLNLLPGEYLVRALVRNARTGRTGVKLAELEVPELGNGKLAVLPPFFLEQPGKWLMFRERPDQYEESTVYPFTVSGEPYVPAAVPVLGKGSRETICIVAYHLRGEEPVVRIQVLDDEWNEAEGGDFSLQERTVTGISGLDKLMATFRPKGLAPGSYRLRILLTDPASGQMADSTAPFLVE